MALLWKVCGVTNGADADAAARAGANALGFIFYERSPRAIEPAHAEEISRRLPDTILRVGVFVNEAEAMLSEIKRRVGLNVLQLSGDEAPQLCGRLEPPVWKALRLPPGCTEQQAENLAAPYRHHTLLLDATSDGSYGGTGETADWTLAASLAARHRLVLAGGLHAGNVAEAVRAVRPWAVDVASGVESRPGHKDERKLRAFADSLRPFRMETD